MFSMLQRITLPCLVAASSESEEALTFSVSYLGYMFWYPWSEMFLHWLRQGQISDKNVMFRIGMYS